MEGLKIHDSFYERLKIGSFRGRVHSVFQKAINIMDEQEILYTILSSEMDEGPMAVHVNEENLSSLGIGVHDFVQGDENQLTLGKITFQVNNIPFYQLPRSEFRPSRYLRSNMEKVRNQLEEMKEVEKSPYDKEVNRILHERIASLKLAFMEEEEKGILESSMSLIGLGPGLTPSGDDVLLGILSVLNLKNHRYEKFRPLFEKVIQSAYEETNILSYYGLRRANDGFIRQDITDFTVAMIEKENIEQELEKILQIGHSSGQDITYGIMTLLEIIWTKEKGV